MLNATGADDCPPIGSRRTARALTTVIMVVGLLVGGLATAQAAAAAQGARRGPAAVRCRGRRRSRRPARPRSPGSPRSPPSRSRRPPNTSPTRFGGGHGTDPGQSGQGAGLLGIRSLGVRAGRMEPPGRERRVRAPIGQFRQDQPSGPRRPGLLRLVVRASRRDLHVAGQVRRPSHPGSFVGLRSIYPGVMGYYHRKDATAFDSSRCAPQRHRHRHGQVPDGSGRRGRQRHRVHRAVVRPAGDATLRTNCPRSGVDRRCLSGRYCVAFATAPQGYSHDGQGGGDRHGGHPDQREHPWLHTRRSPSTIRAVDATTSAASPGSGSGSTGATAAH